MRIVREMMYLVTAGLFACSSAFAARLGHAKSLVDDARYEAATSTLDDIESDEHRLSAQEHFDYLYLRAIVASRVGSAEERRRFVYLANTARRGAKVVPEQEDWLRFRLEETRAGAELQTEKRDGPDSAPKSP